MYRNRNFISTIFVCIADSEHTVEFVTFVCRSHGIPHCAVSGAANTVRWRWEQRAMKGCNKEIDNGMGRTIRGWKLKFLVGGAGGRLIGLTA